MNVEVKLHVDQARWLKPTLHALAIIYLPLSCISQRAADLFFETVVERVIDRGLTARAE